MHAEECPHALKVGILPYMSPQELITLFAPLKEQLQKSMVCPVQLLTAPTLKQYAERAIQRDYDILLAPAHLTRLLQVRGLYVPLAQFSKDLHGAIFVPDDSPIRQASDIRGRRVAVADRTLLLNMALLNMLKKDGIAETDFSTIQAVNLNTALLTAAHGESDAAFGADVSQEQMTPSHRTTLRKVAQTEALPNICISVQPVMQETLREALLKGLRELNSSRRGQDFLTEASLEGIKPIDQKAISALDSYIPQTLLYLGLP